MNGKMNPMNQKGFGSNLSDEESKILETVKTVFVREKLENIDPTFVDIDGKKQIAISAIVLPKERGIVLAKISIALDGKEFCHREKGKALVIYFEKSEKEIAAEEKELSPRIFGETMRNLEIPCV